MDERKTALVESLSDLGHVEPPSPGPMDIRSSRALAVDRVFRGGILALLGLGLGSAFELLHLGTPFVRVSAIGLGMLLGAAGCVWAGRGASHLVRFGRSGHSLTLMAIAGLGLSIGSAGALRVFSLLGIVPWGAGLMYRLSTAVPFFSVIVVLTVLHSLFRILVVDRNSDEPISE